MYHYVLDVQKDNTSFEIMAKIKKLIWKTRGKMKTPQIETS